MGASTEPVRGGRRSFDANLNLVPYVDVLMTIMAFLILTAAWTQLSVLEVQAPQNAKTTTETPETTTVHLTVSAGSVSVRDDDNAATSFASAPGGPDVTGIARELQRLKARGVPREKVEIHVDDGVPWSVVAAVVDVGTAAELGALRLAPTGS